MRPLRACFFSRSLFFAAVLFLLYPICTDAGGDAPICNVSCRPNPSSPTYGGTFTARPLPQNARGSADAVSRPAAGSPRAGVKRRSAGGRGVIAGSQSYSYVVPILNLPGRNGLNVNLNLYYNSAVWTIDLVNKAATFNASQDFPSNGFRLNYGTLEGANGSGYLLTEPDGTVRSLTFFANNDYQTTDSSFIDFNPSTLVLRRPDGSAWVYRQVGTTTVYVPISIGDTNGNYLTIAYSSATNVGNQAISTITDTLGRVITFNYNSSGELTSITAPAFGGGTYAAANFQWGTADLTYDFSLTVNDSPASGTNINVLTGCTYPNGTGYTFSYGGWGIVDEIKQNSSTGVLQSSVSYNYPGGSTKLAGAPTFTQQTIFDGVNTGTWTYANTISNGLVTSMAITDPFSTITTTNLLTSGLPNYVTIGTSSNTLRQIAYTWSGQLPTSITTTLKDTGQVSSQGITYGSYGNVSQIGVSDYGSTWSSGTGQELASGSITLIKITNTYQSATAYINQHIYNRPTETEVFDGHGNLIAETIYAYDASGLTSETGAANHDDTAFGTGFLTRGNLTSTTNYTNPSNGTSISHAYTYDMLGNLLTAQVSCCNQESWTFAPDNQYAYPEVLTRGSTPSFTTDWSYDFSTGLVKTQTDENGQVTSFAYDSMQRITSVTRPDNAVISNSYTDSPAEPTVQTSIPVDSGLTEYQTTTLTGPGQIVSQEVSNSSTSGSITSIVNTAYDSLGRVSEVSNPYASGGSPTNTIYSYDTLSRPVTVTPPGSMGSYQYSYTGNAMTVTDPATKQRETFTDALGRITQVYEPGYADGTNSTGSVTIAGTQQFILETNPNPPPARIPFLDSGTVSLTVGSYTATYNYGFEQAADTPTTIAGGLAYVFNQDPNSPVTASSNGGTLSLTSKVPGQQANYPLSVSTSYDTSDFSKPSFTATTSGATMTGGADGNPSGTPSLATPLVTVSNYDPLGDLVSVFQGQQQRLFVYDGIGRLTQATTPESGTVQYAYTTFNQVQTRTDARSKMTTYAYDGINRLTGITYSDSTSPVSFTYDQGGSQSNANDRLTKMTDGVGSETYQYDILGRETGMTKIINGISYPLTYSYNTASEVKQITYPSGRTVAQTVDALGRPTQVTSGSTNYISGVDYNAAAQPTSFQYGNGVQAAFSYNAQMQLQSLSYSNSSGMIVDLTYGYGTGDNGQIQGVTDGVDPGRTATYTYDSWARLSTAQTTGDSAYPAWGLSFTYDRYGNRTAQSVTKGTTPTNSVVVNPATNQITTAGYSYDASGNMLNDGTNTLTYDAENRALSSSGSLGSATYTYDGNGLRVEKSGSNGSTIYIFSGAKVIAEYAPSAQPSSPTTEYIYAGANLVASITSGTTTYYHPDQLSVRALTNSTGSVVGQQGSYPFGESWYAVNTTTKWFFTSYERDPESANDYAMARYYVNRLGRLNSADPLAGSNADPQSLNRYAYVGNDPANLVDPLGMGPNCLLDGQTIPCKIAQQLLSSAFAYLASTSFIAWYQVGEMWLYDYGLFPSFSGSGTGGGADGTTKCKGTARVIGSGKPGIGAFGAPNDPGTISVIPTQFFGNDQGDNKSVRQARSQLQPFAGQIWGYVGAGVDEQVPAGTNQNQVVTPTYFMGVSDVIGGQNSRVNLLSNYPNDLIIERNGEPDLGEQPVTIFVPPGVPCPHGTLPSN
jgi:RHS repeat-associated protein